MIGLATRITSSAPASPSSRSPAAIRSGEPSSGGTSIGRSPAARSSTTSAHALRSIVRRIAPGVARGGGDPRVERGEALRRVAVVRVPGVPGVDVRQRDAEHARAVGADHEPRALRRAREQHGLLGLPVAARERHPLAGQQPAHDRERLLEARRRGGRRGSRTPGTPPRSSPRPRPSVKRPPLTSPIVAAIFASTAGGWKPAHATSGPSRTRSVAAASAASSVHASHGPRSAGRRRGRAGGRRPRSSRTRPPPRRAPSRGTPASGPRAPPPAAGSRSASVQ